MEAPSSPSSTITAPPDFHEAARRLARMIAEAMTCDFALMHYDSASESMIEWYWPIGCDGKKIPPSHLEMHRDGYDYRFPCCLCADGGGRGAYVESAVYSWWDEGTKKTDWTARCTTNRCGYQGSVFFILKKISDSISPSENRQILPSTILSRLPVPSKRFMTDDKEQEVLPKAIRLEWTHREQTELLKRLNSSIGNGIPAKEFRILFRRCKKCMRVGARPTMSRHICSVIYIQTLSGTCKETRYRTFNRNCHIRPTRKIESRRTTSSLPALTPCTPNPSRAGHTSTYSDLREMCDRRFPQHRPPSPPPTSLGRGDTKAAGLAHPGPTISTPRRLTDSKSEDRVYPGDLWEIIGERSIEARQEETLRRHQHICTGGAGGRHAHVERVLIDERRRRCQMEVSLYSQAIELLELGISRGMGNPWGSGVGVSRVRQKGNKAHNEGSPGFG
ncbi:hypothetical protein DEU56DRAFT_762022 [Suillus clintonianus]|uniref:uncharacterized protein n=1 Tax=Suillus clintonianus TaxID=1904413 RepID=UPI001B865583|nr:uncharacterized protein DEU56DRAFT_762022 [Suillus clintonianus]KAG2112779.1 hypothetical protein DEU56DRAFT_762022 [Suillus clintonianus]